MQIEWMQRLDKRLVNHAKKHKMDEVYTNLELARAFLYNGDQFSRLSVMMDDLCDNEADYLALSKNMVDRLESLRFDPEVALDGASWHLPFNALRLGVEKGSSIPPCEVVFAPKWALEKVYAAAKLNLTAPVDDETPMLLVAIESKENSTEDPATMTLVHTLPEIVELLKNNTFKASESSNPFSLPNEDEAQTMQRVIKVVISLGIYLSLDGVKVKQEKKRVKWAPKVVRTSKKDISVGLLDAPAQQHGRAAHQVREHLRNLKDERYYKGKWANWPRGSRYALIKSHVRGINND